MIPGNLVTLRELLEEDSPTYFKWINDKELVLKNANFNPPSLEEHVKWFNNARSSTSDCIFSIVENTKNQLIGSCSLRNNNPVHHHAELQIRIGERDFHNRGFGSEAVRLLVNHGFTQLNLKRIYLYVFAHNHRAIKAYEKCHFLTEGVLKKGACINDHFVDLKLMAILHED